MKISIKEVKELESQGELLEDINRRLEAMNEWLKHYPKHSERIASLYQDGMRVGLQLKELGIVEHSDFVKIKSEYKDFVLGYEYLWRFINS